MAAKKKPARRAAGGGAASASMGGGRSAVARRALQERNKGIVFGLVAALIGMLVITVIMLFGFQGKLPVLDRCNCSWEKVIVFSVAAFAALALQTVGYLMYQSKCAHFKTITNPRQKERWRKQQMPFFVMTTLLIAVIPVVIVYLVLPLLVDQNGNMLWFVQRGMGIVCILVTFVESGAIGVLQKIIFTKEVA
ncbi:MAG: hypothetical protein E7511_01605 [Ruminococcus sp.]|nr:hypothetical protein [Ruminococcus sp.]